MPVQTGDVIRVDTLGRYAANQDVVGAYQFRLVAGGPMADEDAFDDLTTIVGKILNLAKATSNNGLVWSAFKAANITQELVYGVIGLPAQVVGERSGDNVPIQAAMIVNFYTGLARVVLRKYYGPLAEDRVTPEGLVGASLTAVGVLLAELLLQHFVEANGTWEFGYNSPKAGGWVRPNSYFVSNNPGTQRRRRYGVGS